MNDSSSSEHVTDIPTKDWYARYYASRGDDRNDPLRNAGVPMQLAAADLSIQRALLSVGAHRSWRVLDVGCGSGGSVAPLLRLGFPPDNLTGIDILADRIKVARRFYPQIRFEVADATQLPFEPEAYDLVMESTMFVQITDRRLASGIAREMVRVTKRGGYLLLTDWRYDFWRTEMEALDRRRIRQLFGESAELVARFRGALLPPIGRALSKHAPWLYDLVSVAVPPAVGMVTNVLRVR